MALFYISRVIKTLQLSSEQAVSIMATVNDHAEQTKQHSQNIKETLDSVTGAIDEIVNRNMQIVAAYEQ